jgi:hypothetical protein
MTNLPLKACCKNFHFKNNGIIALLKKKLEIPLAIIKLNIIFKDIKVNSLYKNECCENIKYTLRPIQMVYF